MPCYTTWSRVKVKTQRSVTCNLMKKGGAGDGGVGFWRCTLQQTKRLSVPPPLLLLPSIKVTGSALAKCVVTEALQVYCK